MTCRNFLAQCDTCTTDTCRMYLKPTEHDQPGDIRCAMVYAYMGGLRLTDVAWLMLGSDTPTARDRIWGVERRATQVALRRSLRDWRPLA